MIKTGDFLTPHLADSLRREGRLDEARAVLADELNSLSPGDSCARLAVVVELSKVERASGRASEAKRVLLEAEPLSDTCDSDERRAKYHHALAFTFQLLSETDRALVEYSAASFHWERAGNSHDAGCTENNLALLYLSLGMIEEARSHARHAKSFFIDLPVKAAEVAETEAQICLAGGDALGALTLAASAAHTFAAYGETKLLRDMTATLIKAAVDYQGEGR